MIYNVRYHNYEASQVLAIKELLSANACHMLPECTMSLGKYLQTLSDIEMSGIFIFTEDQLQYALKKEQQPMKVCDRRLDNIIKEYIESNTASPEYLKYLKTIC
jgi:hypothetical protein